MFIAILMIMILWTWGLTPVWVNVTGTILMAVVVFFKMIKLLAAILQEVK